VERENLGSCAHWAIDSPDEANTIGERGKVVNLPRLRGLALKPETMSSKAIFFSSESSVALAINFAHPCLLCCCLIQKKSLLEGHLLYRRI
jgi:hypothetical protein